MLLVACCASSTPAILNGTPARRAGDDHATRDRLLAVQVRLDRAGFSPGEIDGRSGRNTELALQAYQRAHGLAVSGRPDAPTFAALEAADPRDVLEDHTLAAEDVDGPWTPIPEDLVAQAQLPSLGYSSPLERLAERVHASPQLLRALNPDVTFDTAGAVVRVPDVAASSPGPVGTSGSGEQTPGPTDARRAVSQGPPAGRDVLVRVSKQSGTLTVTGPDDAVLFHAPVTVGSERDPLPLGEWTVTLVKRNPIFNYNPDLFWDAEPSHAKARIQAGPNNPVGTVWIGISQEHYGIHGTPEPGRVGHTASHGCVRLTNWDAERLASLVTRGTRVLFEE
jgi:lipoprotein-anchoring transpeptidase ErfK/SrfK